MWRNITWVSVLIYCLKKEGEVGEGGWEEGEVGRRRRRRGGGMGEKGEPIEWQLTMTSYTDQT